MNELPVIYEEKTQSLTDCGLIVSDSTETRKDGNHHNCLSPVTFKISEPQNVINPIKNLSIIEEEHPPSFSKTVSFASSLVQNQSPTSTSSINEPGPGSAATFCFEEDKHTSDDEEENKKNS